MEDVWIHPVSDIPPLWLTDASVRKGIRGMLKIDRCEEEQQRLGIEADGMCAWFGHELAAVTTTACSLDSKLEPSCQRDITYTRNQRYAHWISAPAVM